MRNEGHELDEGIYRLYQLTNEKRTLVKRDRAHQ